jgi:hypothetical protein
VPFIKEKWLGLLTTLVVMGSLTWSVLAGTPAELPGIALGSEAIFHLQRAFAATLVYLLLAVVLIRSWDGDLPSELGTAGLKYTVTEVKRETELALTELIADAEQSRARIEALEARQP